ncbi:hypothetical protein [Nitrospirillum pindoramense]|uniref:Uncharacterized protein n=1 Tax=Nitrospirillum amazonense TaxID=28077 RepID=A0A560HBW1_9PROT|nr:hypothetical protein [Nitrospirillum amazonense]TWB43858.1 hypothetical protein FBZ90_104246 [Nitrospirillum amazonense]
MGNLCLKRNTNLKLNPLFLFGFFKIHRDKKGTGTIFHVSATILPLQARMNLHMHLYDYGVTHQTRRPG